MNVYALDSLDGVIKGFPTLTVNGAAQPFLCIEIGRQKLRVSMPDFNNPQRERESVLFRLTRSSDDGHDFDALRLPSDVAASLAQQLSTQVSGTAFFSTDPNHHVARSAHEPVV